MKGTLFQWFIACLFCVCGMIGTGLPCFSEEPGDSIKDKVIDKWKQYLKKTESVRIEFNKILEISTDTVSRFDDEFQGAIFGDNCLCFEWRPNNTDKKPRLVGVNSEYVFELIESRGESKKWLIKDSPLSLFDKERSEFSMRLAGVARTNHDVANFSFGQIPSMYGIAFLVDHQDRLKLTLEEELENGRVKATMFFREELERPYTVQENRTIVSREIEGEVILHRDRFFYPKAIS